MHLSATLPRMLPLRQRNLREHDTLRAQDKYTPFRSTLFDHGRLDEGAQHGPGALFRDEWNSVAAKAQNNNLSLYKSDRDVTPTIPPAVDATYNANAGHDLALQLHKKGNSATMFKSPTPRFQRGPETSTRGPGAYAPERFTGAFPILSQHATPCTARDEKRRTHFQFERTFAIIPTASQSIHSTKLSTHQRGVPGKRPAHLKSSFCEPVQRSAHTTTDPLDTSEWKGLHSTPLKPALTPRNAYSHRVTRDYLVLHRNPT